MLQLLGFPHLLLLFDLPLALGELSHFVPETTHVGGAHQLALMLGTADIQAIKSMLGLVYAIFRLLEFFGEGDETAGVILHSGGEGGVARFHQ